MKKKVILRLYRQHDIDLITLYKAPNAGFIKAVKHALHAYIKHEAFLFSMPEGADITSNNFKASYRINLFLDEDKDADIIEWLDNIKPLMRNAAIKMIFRGYLIGPYAYGCMKSDSDRQSSKILSDSMVKTPSVYAFPAKKKERNKKNKKEAVTTNTHKESEVKTGSDSTEETNKKKEHAEEVYENVKREDQKQSVVVDKTAKKELQNAAKIDKPESNRNTEAENKSTDSTNIDAEDEDFFDILDQLNC